MMYLFGFSLDNLSLMALTIATGFVVDDAIVMIENIARFVEDGMDPLEAALRGSAQIGFTIISLTISLIAVLIPLLFMGAVVGRLFHEFAITLAVTIVISAVVSLTLVPMMCAKLIRHRPESERTSFDLNAERAFHAAHLGTRQTSALHHVQPDAAQAEDDDLGARLDLRRVDDGADAGGDAAADVANLLERRVLTDLGQRDLRQHREIREGRGAHVVVDRLAARGEA